MAVRTPPPPARLRRRFKLLLAHVGAKEAPGEARLAPGLAVFVGEGEGHFSGAGLIARLRQVDLQSTGGGVVLQVLAHAQGVATVDIQHRAGAREGQGLDGRLAKGAGGDCGTDGVFPGLGGGEDPVVTLVEDAELGRAAGVSGIGAG